MSEKEIDGATGLEATDSRNTTIQEPHVLAEPPAQTDEQAAEEVRKQIDENAAATEEIEPTELTPEREYQILEHLGALDAGRQAAVIIAIRKAKGKEVEKAFIDQLIAEKRMPKPNPSLPSKKVDEISRRMS